MNSIQVPEVDLYKLATKVWKRRLLFLSTVAGCFFLTVIILHLVSPKYTVSMSLAPVLDNSTQTGGRGLSALAKLGGVDLSNLAGSSGQFSLFSSALVSRDAADAVATDMELMKRLFPEQWSDTENRWKEPSSLPHVLIRFIKSILGIPVEPWHPPNGEQIYEILKNDLQVDDDPKDPIVTISIQSDDPDAARELLLRLTASIDSILRHRALDRANDYIKYLTQQLDKVTIADYQAALVQHLFEQEQTRMMASASVSFAAQTFSGPSRSKKPTAPKAVLLLVFSLLVGGSLGVCICVLSDRERQ